MNVTSCEACHLRFEAEGPTSRLCPACAEAGVVLRPAGGGAPVSAPRKRVDPPSLAPSLCDVGAPAQPTIRAPAQAADRTGEPGGQPSGEQAEDWTPIEPVFVDLEPATPPRDGVGARGAGLGTLVALVMAVGVAVTLREPIERAVPATVPFYTAAAAWTGVGANVGDTFTTASVASPKSLPTFGAQGLAIRNVSTQIRQTDAGEQLVVRGEVHNTGDAAALPPLQVTIRDRRDQPRYRWTVATGAPDAKLAPGAIHAFTARSQRVPEDAASVRVDFAR